MAFQGRRFPRDIEQGRGVKPTSLQAVAKALELSVKLVETP